MSLLDLQRSVGNARVVALLADERSRAQMAPADGSPVIHRRLVADRPALYIDDRRGHVLHRKVNNLPALAYDGGGRFSSARTKAKKRAFEAIQAELVRYNDEKGSTRVDIDRHLALLATMRGELNKWLGEYGKEGADQGHKKQRYMNFTLPDAIEAEEKANQALKPVAPRGAEGGVAMPGMSPSPRPRPAPPPPPLPSFPPPPPPPPPRRPEFKAESKEPAPMPRPGHRLALPDHVPGRVPTPPPAPALVASSEEYTDFQSRIVVAHERLATMPDSDEFITASRLFVNDLYANIAQFSQSILAGAVDKDGKPVPGSGISDKNKLDRILDAIDSGNQSAVYRALGIAPPSEKELGLEDLSAKVGVANDAIRSLGAISPAIAKQFQEAATTTNRLATAKGLTGIAVGVGAGFAPVPGVSQAFSAAMAINKVQSTIRHIRRLKRIQVMALHSRNAEMVELLDYIIAKKESKKIKSGVGGVPLLSTASTAIFKMKGLWKMAKGTRGEGRKAAAADLIDSANKGNAEAQMVIMELVDSLEQYKEVLLGGPAGAEIVANKMKSA